MIGGFDRYRLDAHLAEPAHARAVWLTGQSSFRHSQLSPAQHKAVMLAECTARMLYLRDAAEAARSAYAEAAAIHYGTASCYERAVRAWNQGDVAAATAWQKAAEATLDNHRITAPWHQEPAPTD